MSPLSYDAGVQEVDTLTLAGVYLSAQAVVDTRERRSSRLVSHQDAEEFLNNLGYTYHEESDNDGYAQFLR